MEWKDGSSDWIALKDLKESYPIQVADYATNNQIEDEPAFAWWVPYVLEKQKRILKKVKSKYWQRTHKYGIRIPRTIEEAIQIDRENENTLWQDDIKKEMKNIMIAFEEYHGNPDELAFQGYQEITGHIIFDFKSGENFRRKARYVADGHKTSPPASVTYSTVVARDSVRIMLLAAALNNLDVQCADVQNAYLNADNKEKVWLRAGPEFGSMKGKCFIVKRALYGLKSAGSSFRSFLAGKLDELGFESCVADPDVWRRLAVKFDNTEYYEYFLTYVDDLIVISENAVEVLKTLSREVKLKNDLIEAPSTYLGAKLSYRKTNNIGRWTISSVDYVKAAIDTVIESLKGFTYFVMPISATTPMMGNFEPELDQTRELNEDKTTFFQELIGML